MAAICTTNMLHIQLAAEAALDRSIDAAARALSLDPLTAAVCTPGEIHAMTRELCLAEQEFLPGYE